MGVGDAAPELALTAMDVESGLAERATGRAAGITDLESETGGEDELMVRICLHQLPKHQAEVRGAEGVGVDELHATTSSAGSTVRATTR
jgi:hypothetical protein